MRKSLPAIILLLTGALQLSAQTSIYQPARIRVLDNRLDSSICIGEDRLNYRFLACPASATEPPVAQQLQVLLKQQAGARPGTPILINLRQYLPSTQQLWITADIYADLGNDRYRPLGTLEKLYKRKGKSNVNQAALDDLAKIVRQERGVRGNSSAIKSLAQIQSERESIVWASYPINRSPKTADGLFETITNLRRDNIYVCALSLTELTDSVYTLSLPKDSRNKLIWKLKLKPFLQWKGQYYIRWENDIYLHMERKENTFCFRIPFCLSNIWQSDSLNSIIRTNQEVPDPPDGRPSWSDIGVWLLFSELYDLRYSRIMPPARVPHQQGEGRDCYLDLTTRRVICH